MAWSRLLLFLPVLLVGCPDAERGQAAADASAGDAASPGTDPGVSDAGNDGATTSGKKEMLSATAGNLALGTDSVFVVAPTGIVSVPKSGGTASPVVPGSDLTLFSTDADHLYYARNSDLVQISLTGSNPRSLSQQINAAGGLGFDSSTLFWIQFADVVAQQKEDAGITTLRSGTVSTLLLAFSDPYVVILSYTGGTYSLIARKKNTTADIAVAPLSDGIGCLQVVDGSVAYWLENKSGIRAASLDQKSTPVGITGDPSLFDFCALAVDADHVYWAVRAEGRVYRAERTGGTPTVFAEGFVFPDAEDRHLLPYAPDRDGHRLALDDDYLYVSDTSGLYRVRK